MWAGDDDPFAHILDLKGAATATTVRAWRRASILARGHQVVVLAGLFALLRFCRHRNLLGWHLSSLGRRLRDVRRRSGQAGLRPASTTSTRRMPRFGRL